MVDTDERIDSGVLLKLISDWNGLARQASAHAISSLKSFVSMGKVMIIKEQPENSPLDKKVHPIEDHFLLYP